MEGLQRSKWHSILDLFGIGLTTIGLTDSGSRMIGLTIGMTPPANSILPFERDDDNRADGERNLK